MSGQASLLLITVDCLRADHVGFLGYERATTPVLDSLAENSVMFSNAIVAGAPTYNSFPAIMASRYPFALGRDVVGIAPGEETIASVLRDSGYSTAAFLAGNPYLSPRFGYDQGFDTFRDFLDMPENSLSQNVGRPTDLPSHRGRFNQYLSKTCRTLGVREFYDEMYFRYCHRVSRVREASFDSLRRFPTADVIVNHAIEWLAGISGSPFFLWLHLMDPHSPYYPKSEALRSLGVDIDSERARYLNSYWNRDNIGSARLQRYSGEVVSLYDAGIRWADAQIGRLVDELRSRKLWQDCVCAVTGDHGEEFLEHGGRYHSPSNLSEEIIHVPLLLHAPGRQKGKNVWQSPFSLIHLAPTLFDALNLPVPFTFSGRSFWSQVQDSSAAGAEGDGANGNDDGVAIVESVGDCGNPFDASQRLRPRLLAIREAQYKMVFDFATQREDLFNLKNDPGEHQALPRDIEQAVRRRLLKRAKTHLLHSTSARNPDQRLQARLRDFRLEFPLSAGNISA